jgi:hypothetical protein
MYSISDLLRVMWHAAAGTYNVAYDFNLDGVIDRYDIAFLRSILEFGILWSV